MPSTEQSGRNSMRQRILSPDRANNAKKQRQDEHVEPVHLTRQCLLELTRQIRSESSPKARSSRQRFTRLQSALIKKSFLRTSAIARDPGLELRRFARCGGPDLTTIRGFPDPTMSDWTSRRSKNTGSPLAISSIRSGPYNADYEYRLAQNGIYVKIQKDEQGQRIKPANYDEILTRLNAPRPSLSPQEFTDQDFEDFQELVEQETQESEAMSGSMAVIEGKKKHFSRSRGQGVFNNLKPFNPELKMAAPDSYDGAPPSSIDSRVLKDLGQYIVPNTDICRPAVPTFFLEGKSSKGRGDVANRQSAYTGAIGARAMLILQNYPSQIPQYDGNAYSFTNIYHGGILKMYTTHVTAPKGPDDELPKYYLTQLNTYGMTGNSKTFREGATAYRNARDLAKEQRDTFIGQANRKAQEQNERSNYSRATTDTSSTRSLRRHRGYGTTLETDTSTDELALDEFVKRPRSSVEVDNFDDDGDATENDTEGEDDAI